MAAAAVRLSQADETTEWLFPKNHSSVKGRETHGTAVMYQRLSQHFEDQKLTIEGQDIPDFILKLAELIGTRVSWTWNGKDIRDTFRLVFSECEQYKNLSPDSIERVSKAVIECSDQRVAEREQASKASSSKK
jgi:hypothetical protein